jgi:chloramphenicol-sensitive protein RarD
VNRGLWYGAAAYAIWGTFPLYWRLFAHVPTMQVLAHRIVWSFVALAAIILGVRGPAVWRLVNGRVVAAYSVAAVLIGANWFLYVWGVNAGLVVETSLGYFITPLISVLLGVAVFRERLRPLQWLAVGLAAGGVGYLTIAYGSLPWLALGLAFSFGSYGLVKKQAPLGSLEGLTLETAILVVPAAAYLLMAAAGGTGSFMHAGTQTDLLLIGGGLVTIGPLLLFASSVQRAPLSMVGILQYISPTIQFLLGVFVMGEAFTRTQFAGFAIVWAAVAVFALDGVRARTAPAERGVRLQPDAGRVQPDHEP